MKSYLHKYIFKAKSQFPLIIGILSLFISLLPAFLLQSDSFVDIHDQLDGEILVYMLNAKHLLESSFPEFMNGMDSTSMVPPSCGSLFFYIIFSPFTAFFCNYILITFIAFLGMYLLLNVLIENKWISFFVALTFSQLPFYSVYGLSVMGQPLLYYSSIRLWKRKSPHITYAITIFFTLFSSLVLVGFADIILLLVFSTIMQIHRRSNARHAWIQTALLISIYLICNFSLLKQFVLPSEAISHRSELVAEATDFLTGFKYMFCNGAYHAVSLHNVIIKWIIFCILCFFLFYARWSNEEKIRVWALTGLFIIATLIALFYGLWHSRHIVALRNSLGGLFVSFQVDRIYWLYPTIWFTILALVLWLLFRTTKKAPIQRLIACALIGTLIYNTGTTIYNNSIFKRNMELLLNSQDHVSWNDFYSPELFQKIEDYIGEPKENYRIASIALYPSVPLYNGYYCIDGYSNNYNVEYKHQFREIICNELEKSDSLREYFDNWGNRCYIFSAQLGKNYYYTKNSPLVLDDLELSAKGLKLLGCCYVFSGLEIISPEESGLAFVEYFEHENSPYRIWLYKVV